VVPNIGTLGHGGDGGRVSPDRDVRELGFPDKLVSTERQANCSMRIQ